MKINEIGKDMEFEDVAVGAIVWCDGSFLIKIETCFATYEDKGIRNVVNLETGMLGRIFEEEIVSVYNNANLNLV